MALAQAGKGPLERRVCMYSVCGAYVVCRKTNESDHLKIRSDTSLVGLMQKGKRACSYSLWHEKRS